MTHNPNDTYTCCNEHHDKYLEELSHQAEEENLDEWRNPLDFWHDHG